MKLVIFDCDGTLVDSQAMITASLTKAFESQKLAPPSHASMLSIVGLSLINAMRKLAPDESEAQQEALAEAYKAAFWAFRDAKTHEEPLFPGAKAVLDALHAHERIKLGIATGKTRRGVYFAAKPWAGRPLRHHPNRRQRAFQTGPSHDPASHARSRHWP